MSERLLAAQFGGNGTLVNSKPFVLVPIAALVCRAAASAPSLVH
jgi:hypothetical protein